jgi:hypothetical protein
LVGYDRELSYVGNLQYCKPKKDEQYNDKHTDSIEMEEDDYDGNEDDEAIF